MKRRDIIYLNENDFCITGSDTWMSKRELVELFYATRGEIRAASLLLYINNRLEC